MLDALLREGAARHQRGDLSGAADCYRRVLAQRPKDGNALNLLGVAARQQGDLANALRLSARAVALNPQSPVFLANRGAALAEAGSLAEAAAVLRQVLALRPDDAVSLRNLGQLLSSQGKAAEAIAPLRRAVELSPGQPEPLLALAHAARESGDREAAITAGRAALAAAEARGAGALADQARFLLAAQGEDTAPDRAPADYVRALFDQYAPRFDQDLTGKLGYRTPALLAEMIEAAGVAPEKSLQVLDLGCGTGLSGLALAPFAARMEGVDLSSRMLAEAARRGCYAALHEADLLAFLPAHEGRFGLVAAADVLNYLGDLAPALAGIRKALTPGGIAAFSIETMEGEEAYRLGEGMRFRHRPAHVLALAETAGLRLLSRRAVTLRQERGEPVLGELMLFLS
ncbi:methyltransferase domain-containing protein [Acetobacteraceae bacterium H6797]|nr:methyltransferase domain-containing protein [Acetobacteraceae bacterium H6797]